MSAAAKFLIKHTLTNSIKVWQLHSHNILSMVSFNFVCLVYLNLQNLPVWLLYGSIIVEIQKVGLCANTESMSI